MRDYLRHGRTKYGDVIGKLYMRLFCHDIVIDRLHKIIDVLIQWCHW